MRFITIIAVVFTLSIPNGAVFAARTASTTRGEQMLQDMINAESARSAELKVELDPGQGIVHSLQKRSTGNDVKLLQQFLKVYGVYPEGLITGYFGPLTEQAVKRFQERESIDLVGIAGPKTRARIMEISRQRTKENAARSASTVPMITDAVLTTDLAENGAAIAPAASFASTTQNMYAVLALKNAVQDTEIAYVRYLGNAYIDSHISHPSRSNLKFFHFQWSLKPGGSRSAGNYSIVFYLNGKNAKTIQYTIR